MPAYYLPDHEAYAFVSFDGKLSIEDKLHFVSEAIRMYKAREKKRHVHGEKYEGVITTDGKRSLLGTFSGQVFNAEVDTNRGKSTLCFLLREKINYKMN
jgi:hypothetical protein